MNLELASKLLGVDGSDMTALEQAWHAERRHLKKRREEAVDYQEQQECEALLDNVERAYQVLREEATARPAASASGKHLSGTPRWSDILRGTVLGITLTAALIAVIVYLAGGAP